MPPMRLPDAFRRRLRRGRIALVAVPLLGLLALVLGRDGALEHWSFDLPFLLRRNPAPQSGLTLVHVGREEIQRLGASPDGRLLRRHMAAALDRFRRLGARLVVLDFIYDSAQTPEDDAALARAVQECTAAGIPVLLAIEGVRSATGPAVAAEALDPLPDLTRATPHRGVLNFDRTGEGRAVRWLTTRFANRTSLAWEAARLLGAPVTREADGVAGERWLNFYGPPRSRAFARFGISQVLDDGIPAELVRGRVIVVGSQTEVGHAGGPLGDEFAVPWSHWGGWPATGAEIHATAILNLAEGRWLEQIGGTTQALLVVGWGSLLTVLLLSVRPWPALLAALGGVGLLAAASAGVQFSAGRWWCWLVPAVVQTPIALAAAAWLNRAELGRARVFISYRREDGAPFARAIRDALHHRGVPAWLDVADMDSGPFPEQLRRQVETTPAFLLVLTAGVIRRLNQPGDWVAEEIRTAFARRRRIVVLLVQTPPPGPADLPADLAELSRLHAISYNHALFDGMMDQIAAHLTRNPDAGPAQ